MVNKKYELVIRETLREAIIRERKKFEKLLLDLSPTTIQSTEEEIQRLFGNLEVVGELRNSVLNQIELNKQKYFDEKEEFENYLNRMHLETSPSFQQDVEEETPEENLLTQDNKENLDG